jgi:hypothetical protein
VPPRRDGHGGKCELRRDRLDRPAVEPDRPIRPVVAQDEEPAGVGRLDLEDHPLGRLLDGAHGAGPRRSFALAAALDDDGVLRQARQGPQGGDRAVHFPPALGESDVRKGARVLVPALQRVAGEAPIAGDRVLIVPADPPLQREAPEEGPRVGEARGHAGDLAQALDAR